MTSNRTRFHRLRLLDPYISISFLLSGWKRPRNFNLVIGSAAVNNPTKAQSSKLWLSFSFCFSSSSFVTSPIFRGSYFWRPRSFYASSMESPTPTSPLDSLALWVRTNYAEPIDAVRQSVRVAYVVIAFCSALFLGALKGPAFLTFRGFSSIESC